MDTIDLMTPVDNSVCEILPKEEKKVEKVEFKVPEAMEVSHEDDVKVGLDFQFKDVDYCKKFIFNKGYWYIVYKLATDAANNKLNLNLLV